jgi:YD repeat-containing protein
MQATEITDDRMDEVAHVWDARGRLVAQSTQIAAIRVPA